MSNLEIRKKLKKKKPTFIRQDAHKKCGLAGRWRRPKGLQNKVRLKIRGYRIKPSSGWGSPQEVRGSNKDGKKIVHVNTEADLANLKPTAHVIVLSSNLGSKRKLVLLGKIKQQGLTLLDYEVDNLITELENKFQARKKDAEQKRDAKKKKTDKSLDEKVKKKEQKESKEEQSDEDKKASEKKEKDKVLITKS